jgi:hypothetical protein
MARTTAQLEGWIVRGTTDGVLSPRPALAQRTSVRK